MKFDKKKPVHECSPGNETHRALRNEQQIVTATDLLLHWRDTQIVQFPQDTAAWRAEHILKCQLATEIASFTTCNDYSTCYTQ